MRASLDVFFNPANVAVIGATERPDAVGHAVMSNLAAGPLQGRLYPINPKHSSMFGMPCFPDIQSVPRPVDLAVIVTPAVTVPSVIEECSRAGVTGAIIISAGFREAGARGAALEQEIMARRGKMRLIGPNCLGVMNPYLQFNATFAQAIAQPGSIGFISQSGALGTAILDWSRKEMVGFSSFVSVGSMLDVNWGELIRYLGDDPRTGSIVIYMESVGDARSFLSAAREVALAKPIIVIKPGRTEEGARAATSHTGALTGSDEVLGAAFGRCGVLRVNTIAELFYLSEALGKQPRPDGPRLTIVTNAGGPGVLATDALLGEGGQLAELSPDTLDQLNRSLPKHWSHHNPIDILGDAGPERFAKAVEVAAKDPGSDGLLVVLAPTALVDPTAVARSLAPYAHLDQKPVLATWMGGVDVAEGEAILNQAGIPTFAYPDSAARVFHSMWRYSENLRVLYETPELVGGTLDRERAAQIIERARENGRTLLTEAESKSLLAAYQIPVVETSVAATEEDAAAHANRIGYPVAVKLHSETITHKTDVGGVQLDLKDEPEVRAAYRAIRSRIASKDFLGVTVQPMIRVEGYELILGSSIDSQFGPILLFGGGGQLVEIYKDRALGLPPLNTTLARRLMERTKIFRALGGVRGRAPVDLGELERLLVRFSTLVVEHPRIKEIDINPLLASPDRIVALDARVVLLSRETPDNALPVPAIRPYPTQYVNSWSFPDGPTVLIRPIRPEDEPLMIGFHAALSDQSIFLRYFHLISLADRVAHMRLVRHCFVDYDQEIALVAERRGTKGPEILAVARLTKSSSVEGEVAVLITDEMQGKGLGTEMLRRLIDIARLERLHRLVADTLPQNVAMQEVCKALGFRIEYLPEEEVVHAELELA